MNVVRRKVIFITGTGHCGSTLLDLLLSSHRKIFGLGELWNLAIDPAYLKGEKPLSNIFGYDDQFWTPDRIEKLSSFFKQPGFLRKAGIRAGLSSDPRADLYKFLFTTSNHQILVDSSKNINWIKKSIQTLEKEDLDLYLIYLLRDGRAVINSYFRKYPERTLIGIAKKWINRIERIDNLYGRTSVQKIKVKYENLAQEPELTLKDICLFLNIPFEESMLKFWLHEHHHIGGNSGTKSFLLKFQERSLHTLLDNKKMAYYENHNFGIKLDERWKNELNAEQLEVIDKEIGFINNRIISEP